MTKELCEGLPERSLFAFSLNNPIRKMCIYVIRSWFFDQFILSIIFLNCIFLAMQTREPGFDESARGKVVHTAEYIFTSIFLVELVVKVYKPNERFCDGGKMSQCHPHVKRVGRHRKRCAVPRAL